MKDKHFHIKSWEIPLYRGYFVVMLTNDTDAIKQYIPMFEDRHIYGHTYLWNYKRRMAIYITLNFNSEFRSITHGTITHEVIHACNFLLNERGVKSDYDNDEPMTYLSEWYTDKIYQFMKQKGFEAK